MSARGVAATTPAEAVRATNRHYELPPEFFAAFLDKRLKYSCALYRDAGMSLDDAQTEKLHFIAGRLGIKGGERVLDVGCGWGSLSLFLAVEYGCETTGVTPSASQAAYIRRQAEDLGVTGAVRLKVGSFSDVDCDGGYDAAAFVGSINHMPNQTAVLTKARRLLRADGRLYLSESCFRSASKHAEFSGRPGTRQVTAEIFGFADMVPLSALVRGVEDSGLSVIGAADLTANFYRTVEDWTRRAVQNRRTIEATAPGMYEPLLRYLETTNAGWGYTSKHYALTAMKSRLGSM